MKGLTKFVTVLAKILEVFAWVGSALVLCSLIAIAAGQTGLLKFFSSIETEEEIRVAGMSIDMSVIDPSRVITTYVVVFVALLLILILMGMIFRNIHLIFKTAEGKTKYSKGCTPFQPDIIRMVREVGIFSLLIPAVQIIMSIIARIVIGHEAAEIAINIDLTTVFFGLVVLCLSQFFAYGAKLQEETEGLV